MTYQLDADLAAHQFRYVTVGLGSNFDPTSEARRKFPPIWAAMTSGDGQPGRQQRRQPAMTPLTMDANGTDVGVGASQGDV